MSTSRRHSLGVPMPPITLGRRLSLDTMATDSDGEREEDEEEEEGQKGFFPSQQEQTYGSGPGEETDDCSLSVPCPRARVTSMACGVPRRHLYSRSEILATDECSPAAHISRVVQTSQQAARAAGAEEFDPEENLHSTDGQSHMLMVQKVLQELKLYHGVKQGNNRLDTKVTGSVTWYEFLSNENEGEEDRTEKVEKGTKVKRTLSSLRNRVTGSFNKDKGKNREKEHQKEKEKEKDTVCGSRRCHGHHLVRGSFSSCATCSLCSKTLQRKHGLQCMTQPAIVHLLPEGGRLRGVDCAVNVHKSCKSLLGECTSSRNKLESCQTHLSSPLANQQLVQGVRKTRGEKIRKGKNQKVRERTKTSAYI
ncbi:hypothetical protein F7725_027342 [Dissostichus mawsoni]|uniref:Phorbol-ester/DAG-type domain-containing protein n=1 Tax=Dissostichus mawsoni TaxID=36200 RepID=A0A7J5XCQ3_DISMA|nr:hypothetical protein F7725_027342 [Dissostichus mawsoni]